MLILANQNVAQGGKFTFRTLSGAPSSASLTLRRGGTIVYGPITGTVETDHTAWDLASLGLNAYDAIVTFNTGTGDDLHASLTITIIPSSSIMPVLDSALNISQVIPNFDSNTVESPGTLFWEVRTLLLDSQGNIVSESPACPLQSVYVDIPSSPSLEGQFGGAGAASYPSLRQMEPLIPVQKPRIIRISPAPGFVHQDSSPE